MPDNISSANIDSFMLAPNYADMRSQLGLVIGTNVQAFSTNLQNFSSKAAPSGTVVGDADNQTLTNKTLGSGTVLSSPPTMTIGSDATGDIYYRSSGGVLTRLPIGATNNVLTVIAGLPAWQAPAIALLAYFTESRNVTIPNNVIPVHSFSATGTETDIDCHINPKGTGAIVAQIPNNLASGGNKRGSNATDLQRSRSNANQVASGNASFASGQNNLVSGNTSVGIGTSNTVSGNLSMAVGSGCTASGLSSFAFGDTASATSVSCYVFGSTSMANGVYSFAMGKDALSRVTTGAQAHSIGQIATQGDRQARRIIVQGTTTNATPTVINSAGTNMILPNNSTFLIKGVVLARYPTAADSSGWDFSVMISRGANAAATALVSPMNQSSVGATVGAATWDFDVVADTTSGCPAFTVTGEVGKTIQWIIYITSLELVA